MSRHIIESQQFSQSFITTFFELVARIKKLNATDAGRASLSLLLAGKILINFFYEESTRTRVSFNMAAQILGMKVIETTNAAIFSSAAKGESLSDTLRVLSGYRPDIIVLRHKDEGSAKRAAAICDARGTGVSLINAGDGTGQHPSQALIDLYTIYEKLGHLDNLHIVVVGDLLFGRTTHSLVYLLSLYPGVRFTFVSPPQLAMKSGILEHLDEHKVPWTATDDLSTVVGDADVVYMTRTQWERLFVGMQGLAGFLYSMSGSAYRFLKRRELRKYSAKCRLTDTLAQTMKPGAIILHPMPILDEIERPPVDTLQQAVYFDQSDNGIPVRIALLLHVLGHDIQL